MSVIATPAPRFSPSDAVFSVFERGRVPPGRMARTFGLFMLTMLVTAAPMLVFLRLDLLAGVNPDVPQYSFPLSQGFGSLIGLLAWPLIAAAEASLLRGMLKPTGGSVARDAMIVLATYVVIILLFYGVMLISMIPGMFILVALMMAVAAIEASAEYSSAATTLVPVIAFVVMFTIMMAAPLYVMLRLSLAQAISVADGRFRIFESWRMTRGAVWRLFGAHFLRCVFMLLGWLLVCAVAVIAGFILMRGEVFPSLEAFFGGAPLPSRAVDLGVAIYGLAWIPLVALYFVDTAMRAGIGASFLESRRVMTQAS